ncbi:MAG: hypothetical protein H6817_01985 [Phycisphaerales bacterium]|nr:hypothetical protein [Phycisphaerales bacterium]
MTTRNRTVTILTLFTGAMLLSQVGCGTAIKTAYYEVRGAKVKVVPATSDVQRAQIMDRFAPYKSFSFQPCTTTLGSHICPPKVINSYDAAASALPGELTDQYPGDGPALTITSDVQFFEPKGLLGAALMFTRVNFIADGNTVLDALVVTKSRSFREGGRGALAEETVKGIGKFLVSAKTGEKELDDMLP